jgi:hypothetical protein
MLAAWQSLSLQRAICQVAPAATIQPTSGRFDNALVSVNVCCLGKQSGSNWRENEFTGGTRLTPYAAQGTLARLRTSLA